MSKTMGRPTIEVNWDKFEFACELIATKEEICGLLRVSDATLQRRVKEKYGDTFEGVLRMLSGKTKVSLRRYQLNLARTNASMGIWLGKQLLGQTEKIEITNDSLIEEELEFAGMPKGKVNGKYKRFYN